MSGIRKVPVMGYEGIYWIKSNGKILSKRGILKPAVNTGGYPAVSLSKDRHAKTWPIHRLVALHFIPNPGYLPQINHINGIKTDFRISNLEWCTAKQNMQHAWRTGLITSRDTKTAKMTEKQVDDMYWLYKYGHNKEWLAERFNISVHTVKSIIIGKNWKHLNLKEKYENEFEDYIQTSELIRKRLERLQSSS